MKAKAGNVEIRGGCVGNMEEQRRSSGKVKC